MDLEWLLRAPRRRLPSRVRPRIETLPPVSAGSRQVCASAQCLYKCLVIRREMASFGDIGGLDRRHPVAAPPPLSRSGMSPQPTSGDEGDARDGPRRNPTGAKSNVRERVVPRLSSRIAAMMMLGGVPDQRDHAAQDGGEGKRHERTGPGAAGPALRAVGDVDRHQQRIWAATVGHEAESTPPIPPH